MDFTGLRLFVFAYFIWRAYCYFKKEWSEAGQQNNEVPEAIKKEYRPIKYMVNGRYIAGNHIDYYLNILELDFQNYITDDRIKLAAGRKRREIAIYGNDDSCISEDDLEAAENYMLDQWEYFVNRN